MISLISLQNMVPIGMNASVITIEIGSMKPLYHPKYSMVAPRTSYPSPEPVVPIPSMMPVIVDVARLPFCCLPRSAVAVMQIKWCKLPMKNPRKNMRVVNMPDESSLYLNVIVKLTMVDTKIESIPIGDLRE